MRAWITLPFDDKGIGEIEITGKVDDANLHFRARGSTVPELSHYWYREGVTWHRSYDAALDAAKQMRADRIAKLASEVTRVAALPPIPSRPL